MTKTIKTQKVILQSDVDTFAKKVDDALAEGYVVIPGTSSVSVSTSSVLVPKQVEGFEISYQVERYTEHICFVVLEKVEVDEDESES